MGGKSNIKCDKHFITLITYIEWSNKFQCGNKYFLWCYVFNYKIFLRKICFEYYGENGDKLITASNNGDYQGPEEQHALKI